MSLQRSFFSENNFHAEIFTCFISAIPLEIFLKMFEGMLNRGIVGVQNKNTVQGRNSNFNV